MKTPLVVVVTVCLHVWHPPLFTHLTVIVPSMDLVLFGLQSGLFGSALVHSQPTLTSTPKPPLPIRRRDRGAVIVMAGVTSRRPGRSRKRNRFVIGREVVRRGCFAIFHSPLAGGCMRTTTLPAQTREFTGPHRKSTAPFHFIFSQQRARFFVGPLTVFGVTADRGPTLTRKCLGGTGRFLVGVGSDMCEKNRPTKHSVPLSGQSLLRRF
jgi:hypothetical protein